MKKTLMTDQGLLIPNDELARLGDIVLEERGALVIIRPRSMVEATRGIVPSNAEDTDRLIRELEASGLWEDHAGESA